MAYVEPTLTDFNANPPSDDAARTTSNQLRWSTHLTKLAIPLRNYAQAISAAVRTAFETVPDYAISDSEATNLISIENYKKPYGHVLRYGNNTVPGVTDLTAAIRAALNSGHDVTFPAELIAVDTSSALSFADAPVSMHTVDKYFFGLTSAHDGRRFTMEKGGSIKVIGGGTGRDAPHLFFLHNTKDLEFIGLNLDGNAASSFTSNPRVLINGTCAFYMWSETADGDVANITWRDCYFTNWSSAAIYGYGHVIHALPHFYLDNLVVETCLFESLGDHGIGALQWRDGKVNDCEFKNVGQNIMISGNGGGLGVDFSAGCTGCVASNCVVDGASGGFKTETHDFSGTAEDAPGNTFENCVVRNLQTGSGYEVWYGFKCSASRTVVRGCTVEDVYAYGIYVNATDCTIEGNYLLGNSLAGYSGIECAGYDPRFTPAKLAGNQKIRGNVIRGFQGWGILGLDSDSIIEGNIVEGNGLGGIRVADKNDQTSGAGTSHTTENVVVANNIVKDNVGTGIAIAPLDTVTLSNINVFGNICFDSRVGGSRTQTYGLFIPGTNTTNVVDGGNNCFNNVSADYSDTTVVVSRAANGLRYTYASAAPTTGTWAVGDIAWNNATAAGGSPGWVCTTAGTPGTWKAMATVDP